MTLANRMLFAASIVLGLGASQAMSQDSRLGEEEFQQRCAVCHGAEGAGDGMVGELFATRPKDLRVLSRENGGAFPFDRVASSIDGRMEIAGHGATEMPVWGDFLMTEALEARSINEKDARTVVDARIIALANYIQSLQVE